MSARLARALVLVAWAEFFATLWVTGEITSYLGPRTAWVVPFGAITLGITALAYALAAASSRRPAVTLSRAEAAGLLALVVPIVGVALVPDAELGALAASRKATDRAVSPQRPTGGEVSFAEIDYARFSPLFADEVGIEPGRRVQLVGFVSHEDDQPPGMFDLGRFYISCCVADALPTTVTIDARRAAPGTYFATDTWLKVSGPLAKRAGEFVVRADSIVPAEVPQNPYLYLR